MVCSTLTKIRGRNKSTGDWRYGNYLIEFQKRRTQCTAIATVDKDEGSGRFKSCLDVQSVEGDTVSRYAGVNDRDDYEIYDGDIISCDGSNWLIQWDQEEGFAAFHIPMMDISDCKMLDEFDYSEVEVVGNMWDNPEMLSDGI